MQVKINLSSSSTTGVTSSYQGGTQKLTKQAAIQYTITYNANGGSGTMASHKVTPGSSVKIKDNEFTRTGYTFAGWTTKSDGSDDGYGWSTSTHAGWSGTWNYTNGQYGIANNKLALYARWAARPSQNIYIYNDGTIYARGYFTSDSIYFDNTGAIYAPAFTTGTSFYISSSGIVAKSFKEGTP